MYPRTTFLCSAVLLNATIGGDRYALPVIQLDSLFWTVLLHVNTVEAQGSVQWSRGEKYADLLLLTIS